MLKRLACLTFLCLVLSLAAACGESVTYQDLEVDTGERYLDLGERKIKNFDTFYAFLDQLPALEQVDMFATPMTVGRIEELTGRYPRIRFGMTMRFGEHTLRTDATAFSTLHTSDSGWHSDRELSLVRFCPNLYALDLGHNALSDLSFLYEMPQLRVLIIAIARVQDITPIASLKHLEYLEVFYNQITDISPLAGLTELMDLNITYNYIEDLSPLMELSGLRRLWMNECNKRKPSMPDAEMLEKLRQALPECEIDPDSTSTGGTWRTHPHYDVIYSMFRSGVYQPFADSRPENLPDGYVVTE